MSFNANEIASVAGVTKRAVQSRAESEKWPFETKSARGGQQRYYALEVLPAQWQAALLAARPESSTHPSEDVDDAKGTLFDYDSEALWAWAQTRSKKQRDLGAFRAKLCRQVRYMVNLGRTVSDALRLVGHEHNTSAGTIKNWYFGVNGQPGARSFKEDDWEVALISGYSGRPVRDVIPQSAWDWFLGYYLTRRRPTFAESYRRVCEVAEAEGWGKVPDISAFRRRIKREIDARTIKLRREGQEALALTYPPQRRDKSAYAAGAAVVGDGLKFDRLWIKWDDGEILNTTTGWFWADLRTNYMIAYRLAKTENTDLFRLATYDLTETCKPADAWVDNTPVAANKAMTGRAQGRNRFHDKERDPIGLMESIGMRVHFTSPDAVYGSPGAKPIERSFGAGGIHDKVATHPAFLNRGFSKATAIPFEEFAEVVKQEVARFNMQPKRQTAICRGVMSFKEAFDESYARSQVTKLSDIQRQLLLLMPEVTRCSNRTGEIALKACRIGRAQHRFYHERLFEYAGQYVIAYYDPDHIENPAQVHTMDGRLICEAKHQGDVAFTDTAAAGEHRKQKQRYVKAAKKAAEAQVRMSELEVAAKYPKNFTEAPTPPPGVVGGAFGVKKPKDAAAPKPDTNADDALVRHMDWMTAQIKKNVEEGL